MKAEKVTPLDIGSPIHEGDENPVRSIISGSKSPIAAGSQLPRKSIMKKNVNIDENYLKTPLLLKESDPFG